MRQLLLIVNLVSMALLPTASNAGPLAAGQQASLCASLDSLWSSRHDPEIDSQVIALLEQVENAVGVRYELAWRTARALMPTIIRLKHDKRATAALAKRCHCIAERARALAPERIEGHYYGAICIGLYGNAINVATALYEGINRQYCEAMEQALATDPGFDHGGPYLMLGHYWSKAPWPIHDGDEALRMLRLAVVTAPDNGYARLVLAEVLLDEDQTDEACAQLAQVRSMARPDWADDEEWASWQQQAAELAQTIDQTK